jgi:hypothetical protein
MPQNNRNRLLIALRIFLPRGYSGKSSWAGPLVIWKAWSDPITQLGATPSFQVIDFTTEYQRKPLQPERFFSLGMDARAVLE